MHSRIQLFLVFCCAQIIATAQQPPLTLQEATQQALERYPVVRSSLEQVAAAEAAVNLARTTYLPRADFLGEVNRATHNNVFGQILPQAVIPSMTGPVSARIPETAFGDLPWVRWFLGSLSTSDYAGRM